MRTSSEGISTMDTRDWNEAARAVSGAYFPHELTSLSSDGRLDLSMRTVDLGPVTVGRLGWGADVAIECDYPNAYEVNMPLSGRLESVHGSREVVSGAGQGTIFPPNTATPITRWSRDCAVVGVKFDQGCLERERERVLASRGPGTSSLPDRLEGRTAETRSWLHFVRMLSADLVHMSELLNSDLIRGQISGAITTGFLLAVSPDCETAPVARPRIVNRVLDQLHDDPARAWTVADMATVAGVSVRRLQEGFREYVGKTPLSCLRDIRLARAHDELELADDSVTVTEVATRWGFTHTGRFAAAYRRNYGVSPSESLRS
ncbi:AraC-like DNA-binding protein [Saccharopolyspora lacisalsi]|uniref:AraC-like DNA-binding protein n=1 Tax=Halosaccharopolyspora lacisalsi TaxID=1000566 RepID=A0A839DZG6_9PSEU|nr:AraC family transcriptional regulator [Halosaccharopolyspora lacisalsi]MBA8826403.1 AraC-like DNA-binding protein [Halosaccharopolyspora lacisalsi]